MFKKRNQTVKERFIAGQKQRRFYHTVLKPLMDGAQTGEISLLFLDASHFVMGCNFLGYIYGRVRRFVKTFSGRRRYNVPRGVRLHHKEGNPGRQ
jgi:hypothetical protein